MNLPKLLEALRSSDIIITVAYADIFFIDDSGAKTEIIKNAKGIFIEDWIITPIGKDKYKLQSLHDKEDEIIIEGTGNDMIDYFEGNFENIPGIDANEKSLAYCKGAILSVEFMLNRYKERIKNILK